MNADSHQQMHQEIADLIPWYVNNTLGALERQKVDSHVLVCASCRDVLMVERRIFEGMSATDPAVEYMPAASLKRLMARIDAPAEVAQPPEKPLRVPNGFGPRLWTALAASLAVIAVVAALHASRWSLTPDLQPSYHTVTSAAARPSGEIIRAVFSPTLTVVELKALLDQAHLEVVAGPTEAGVYSLAATSPGSARESLGVLRGNPGVRFAESTRTEVADPSVRESP